VLTKPLTTPMLKVKKLKYRYLSMTVLITFIKYISRFGQQKKGLTEIMLVKPFIISGAEGRT